MNPGTTISISSLLIALIISSHLSLLFSYYQKLGLEKETIISVGRAIIQLVLVGYILEYIFGQKNPVFTTGLLMIMTFNAAYNAAKRGQNIKKGLLISFVAIAAGTIITLSILLFSGAIHYEPFPNYSYRRNDH